MKNYQKIFNENAYCILTSNFSNKIVDNARQSFVGILKKSKNAIYKKIRVYDDYSSILNIAGIENIFDSHYREFASGISAPGRSLILGVGIEL